VDVHHIVPWAKVQDHTFENLIALCPNCHRRAERGDIDRTSLRLYKARLAAAFRFEEVSLYPEELVLPAGFGWLDPAGGWRAETLNANFGCLEITIEYPQFSANVLGEDAHALNVIVRELVDASVASFDSFKDEPPDDRGRTYYLQGSFSVALLRASMVSVRFTFESYTGGAHGAHWTESMNVHTDPVRTLGIADIFEDAAVGLSRLSEYVIRELLRPTDGYARDEASVRTGAGPDPKNFRTFNVTSRGLLIRFDEYQVGSYAEGPSDVHVPYAAIAGVTNRDLAAELYGL
jgi:hypothetical protein